MKPINGFGVSSLQVAKNAVEVIKLDGQYLAQAAASWLQVHDSVAAPAAGAVPLKQWPTSANSEFYKEFKRGSLICTLGCWVGLSSTDGTFTAPGAGYSMDVSVELSDPEILTGTSLAGDLTTAVTGLQVWSEAAGVAARKHLLALEVDGTNLTGSNWIMLFATDTVNVGDSPLQNMIFPIAAGQVRTGNNGLKFGEFTRDMQSYDGTNWHYGCTVKISSTPSTYTDATGTAAIRAQYK